MDKPKPRRPAPQRNTPVVSVPDYMKYFANEPPLVKLTAFTILKLPHILIAAGALLGTAGAMAWKLGWLT